MEQWEAKGGVREIQISELSLQKSLWEWREVTGHYMPGIILGPGETMTGDLQCTFPGT